MLNNLMDKIECEICEEILEFSASDTIDDYTIVLTADATNVFDKVEEIIGKYLVYICPTCHAKYKYTYKDLERVLRKNLTQKMLMLVVRGIIINNNVLQDKLLFYCGKCNGYDGKGGCPKTVYNKCEIKRFPTNES
jgi:hypothetical protein